MASEQGELQGGGGAFRGQNANTIAGDKVHYDIAGQADVYDPRSARGASKASSKDPIAMSSHDLVNPTHVHGKPHGCAPGSILMASSMHANAVPVGGSAIDPRKEGTVRVVRAADIKIGQTSQRTAPEDREVHGTTLDDGNLPMMHVASVGQGVGAASGPEGTWSRIGGLGRAAPSLIQPQAARELGNSSLRVAQYLGGEGFNAQLGSMVVPSPQETTDQNPRPKPPSLVLLPHGGMANNTEAPSLNAVTGMVIQHNLRLENTFEALDALRNAMLCMGLAMFCCHMLVVLKRS